MLLYSRDTINVFILCNENIGIFTNVKKLKRKCECFHHTYKVKMFMLFNEKK